MAKAFAGSKIYIGTTTSAENQSEFEGDSYTEVKNVSNMGEFGGSANVLTFPVVADEFVRKSKGTRDGGDPALVVGRLANDPGQVAVRAAEKTSFYYNFKLELNDAESELYSNTVIYFRAIVAGVPMGFGGVEDFVTETYTLGVYPRPVIVESALISP